MNEPQNSFSRSAAPAAAIDLILFFAVFSSRPTTHPNTRNVDDGSQWLAVYDYADGLPRTYDTFSMNVSCCDDVSFEHSAQCEPDISRRAVEPSSSP